VSYAVEWSQFSSLAAPHDGERGVVAGEGGGGGGGGGRLMRAYAYVFSDAGEWQAGSKEYVEDGRGGRRVAFSCATTSAMDRVSELCKAADRPASYSFCLGS
jgi:hypothetical protein